MKSIEVCGINDSYGINEKSNSKSKDGRKIVYPPILSNLDASKILSYSSLKFTVAVTTDGAIIGTGDNSAGAISGSIPKSMLRKFTDIKLKDGDGLPCTAKSVVCGYDYTLYLIMSNKKEHQLAYANSKLGSEFPIILNILLDSPFICTLYGGCHNCAAIEAYGRIILISDTFYKTPTKQIKPISLPSNELAASVAWSYELTILLSSNGRLYKLENGNQSLKEVPELKNEEIISISGIENHCFAVSQKGRVYVIGQYCINGQLGLGPKITKVDKFTEIPSLSKYKIVEAYAGSSHSLFKTENGKIFACGDNRYGQLFLSSGPSEKFIFEPVETTVKNATSCIAGYGTTTIFKNFEPLHLPNKSVFLDEECPEEESPEDSVEREYEGPEEEESPENSGEGKYKSPEEEESPENSGEREYEGPEEEESPENSGEGKYKSPEEEESPEVAYLDPHELEQLAVPPWKIEMIYMKQDIEKLKKQLEEKNKEIEEQKAKYEKQLSDLQTEKEEQKKEYEKKLSSKNKEIKKMKSEISSLKKEQKSDSSSKQTKSSNLEIFDCKAIDELKVVKTVGRGAQSEVFEVNRQQRLALKVLLIEGSDSNSSESFKKLQRLLQEYEILQLLNHRNIIRSFGFCYGDEKHAPSILLEFCVKNLNDAVLNMSDIEKVCSIVEICMGMEAVHNASLIHRDLKPENILIDESGHVKISDFGISCYVEIGSQTQSKTAGVGTLKFMAPELLIESKHYNCKVDVYSFGVVLFFVLTGKLPRINLIDQGRGKKAAIPKSVNKISKELLNKCWEFEPNNRPSFSEIIKFIKDNNFKLIDGVEKYISEIKCFLSL